MIHHAPNRTAASLPAGLDINAPGLAIAISLSRTAARALGSTAERTLTISIRIAGSGSAGEAGIEAVLGALDLRAALGLPARAAWRALRDAEHGLTHVEVEGVGEFAQASDGSVAYARVPALEALGGGRYQIEWSID